MQKLASIFLFFFFISLKLCYILPPEKGACVTSRQGIFKVSLSKSWQALVLCPGMCRKKNKSPFPWVWGEECSVCRCRLLGGERAPVTLSCIHPPSPEPSLAPDGFHKQMRRLLWVHCFNEARMADSCNKYLIMLMKIVFKNLPPHTAPFLHSRGAENTPAQPKHLHLPQPLQVGALALTKDFQTCACIEHCHPLTRALVHLWKYSSNHPMKCHKRKGF